MSLIEFCDTAFVMGLWRHTNLLNLSQIMIAFSESNFIWGMNREKAIFTIEIFDDNHESHKKMHQREKGFVSDRQL
jgi:hypothetical protein